MKLRNASWSLISGACVGWLVGLSASPVVNVVISTVLGLVAGVIAGVGAESEGVSQALALPGRRFGNLETAGILLLGIACGSSIGILARTYHWFSPSPDKIIEEWSTRNRDIDRSVIARRLFDESYPPVTEAAGRKGESEPNKDSDQGTGVAVTGISPNTPVLLSHAASDVCATFKLSKDEDLRKEMQNNSKSRPARDFADKVDDPRALRSAVEIFVCPGS